MASRETTLGGYIAELMEKHQHSNRSLAATAGISEGAVRNILKYGREKNTKDPDARTLQQLAKALEVDSLYLFRLAGYIEPEPAAHTVRGNFLATLFDQLPIEKQDAILGLLETMVDNTGDKDAIAQIREDPENPLAGMDLALTGVLRDMANQLIVQLELTQGNQAQLIKPDTQIFQYKWKDLPVSTQERIKALIRYKLSLDYDPTMVDPKWRD